ncbi:hypothetical protein X772_36275 [Mesorhizobium sp. LSJC280B00]|nr:hypothetical protein X772_36275 [Mesorhizobium sp. LSJC280B00]
MLTPCGEASFCPGQECKQDPHRIVIEAREITAMPFPFRCRDPQRLRVLLKIVVEHGERHAPLQVRRKNGIELS